MEHLDESRRTQKRQVISAEDLPEVCSPPHSLCRPICRSLSQLRGKRQERVKHDMCTAWKLHR